MQEIEEEVIGSQSEDSEQHDHDDSVIAALEAFGIEQDDEKSVNDKPPAKEEVVEDKTDAGIERVKHNKEEREVDISTKEKLHDHLQRSLALDKERERREKNDHLLKEAATLLGLESLDEPTIQRLRQEREQLQQRQEQNEYNQLRASLREEAEDAGLDPDRVEAYLNNHPLMKEAQKAKEERENDRLVQQHESRQREERQKWGSLYEKYPQLASDSEAFDRGETPNFFTPEMKRRVDSGYDPIDAFELAHRDTLSAQTKKAVEQKVIKQQQLGLRSQVETLSTADKEPQVSAELASAFEAFGLPVSAAKKYAKK